VKVKVEVEAKVNVKVKVEVNMRAFHEKLFIPFVGLNCAIIISHPNLLRRVASAPT
jgi:hypothetical protein